MQPGFRSLTPRRKPTRLAGYADSEQWWETHLEHAPGNADTFALVLELMTALRDELRRP